MFNKLTDKEKEIIINKGTEPPFSGKYNNFFEKGVYLCKRCNALLYSSKDKFKSTCGWPSFDDEIKGAIKRDVDADGIRIEIMCAKCGAHLGHVFKGEMLTDKNTRHCVNSISLKFKKEKVYLAYFAGGCFWGVEHLFRKKYGVIDVVSGYMGGDLKNPTYKEVCSGNTGHIETVKVEYNRDKVSFEELTKFFFEIHNFEQTDGQGLDIGTQYLSTIFYATKDEKIKAKKIVATLEKKGYLVSTRLKESSIFYKAEDYHQRYYERLNKAPSCHFYKKVF